jgi:hypothetical protein
MSGNPKFRQLPGWGNPARRLTKDEKQLAMLVAGVKEILEAAIFRRPDLATLDERGFLDLAFDLVTNPDNEPPPG